jgi:hypothetical protein
MNSLSAKSLNEFEKGRMTNSNGSYSTAHLEGWNLFGVKTKDLKLLQVAGLCQGSKDLQSQSAMQPEPPHF